MELKTNVASAEDLEAAAWLIEFSPNAFVSNHPGVKVASAHWRT